MTPAKLVFTYKAEDDLNSIFRFLAENHPSNAVDYIDGMRAAIENLIIFPCMGVECKTKGIDRDCRILILDKYLIFYQFDEDDNEIKILRILHGSRKYHELLK